MQNDSNIQIKTANQQDVKRAKQFYKAQRYHGKARKGDILVEKHDEDTLIALLRLTNMQTYYLLRNLCVARNYRRQGHGADLIAQSCQTLTKPIYTFPLAELANWYERCGASLIEPADLPPALLPYYQSYAKRDPSLRCALFTLKQ